MRYILSLLMLAACLSSYGQTVESLKKEIERAEAEIKKNNELLQGNKSRQKNSLSNLSLVDGNIKNRKSIIESLDKQTKLIKGDIARNNKDIGTLAEELDRLKREYAAIVVTAYKEYKTGSYLAFLFSASDLGDMTRRAAYIRRHLELRRSKGQEIAATRDRIEQETAKLHGREKELNGTITARNEEVASLTREEARYRNELAALRKEEKNIGAAIAENRKVVDKLQTEIRRIIEEQARRDREASAADNAALSKLTGDFTAAKGKLPHPVVGGAITEHFGIHPHPLQPTLKVDNKGITYTVGAGSNARAVFAGDVTKVFSFQGMGTTVMVRHGSYITVFSNLAGASVKAGDKVRAGDRIGTVSQSGGGGSLHFELWKETTPINPEPWFAK